MIASTAHRREALGLAESDLERARAVVTAALSGRRALTRRDLLAMLDAAAVGTAGQR